MIKKLSVLDKESKEKAKSSKKASVEKVQKSIEDFNKKFPGLLKEIHDVDPS